MLNDLNLLTEYKNAISRLDKNIFAWEEIFDNDFLSDNVNDTSLPLHGVTVGIKDIFKMKNRLPRNGSKLVKNEAIPKENAQLVELLIKAGAVIVGVTKPAEFSGPYPTDTRNPHNLSHTPGGSSSGSAAAVASGMVDIAIGSQTRGSTLRPGSFCGVFAFKPTLGVVSMAGATPVSYSIDHPGFFSRDIDLITKTFDSVYEIDYKDPKTAYLMAEKEVESTAKNNFKIGILDIFSKDDLHEDMLSKFNDFKAKLSSQGHKVNISKLNFNVNALDQLWKDIVYPELFMYHNDILSMDEANLVNDKFKNQIKSGKDISLQEYLKACLVKDKLTMELNNLFNNYDLLILPASLGPAPKGLNSTGDAKMNVIASLTGNPAISIPYGATPQGLPLGIQVIGKKYDDKNFLGMIKQLPQEIIVPEYHFLSKNFLKNREV